MIKEMNELIRIEKNKKKKKRMKGILKEQKSPEKVRGPRKI